MIPMRSATRAVLGSLFDRVMDDLGLRSVGSVWHKFPGEGGVTGLDRSYRIASRLPHIPGDTAPRHLISTAAATRPRMGLGKSNKSQSSVRHVVTVTQIERGQ